jgi:excisionase family DNA binding protein
MDREDLIDVREVSRLTGLERQTIYKLVARGQLKAYRVLRRSLRFAKRDVEGLIREREAAAV